MPVYKFTGEVNKVQPKKLESRTEEKHKTHLLLKNKFLHDNEASPKSVKSVDESIMQKSQMINIDSITSSSEVIDGTTIYSDNEPSIQPNFVSKVVEATASLNEQDSIDSVHSKINPDHKEPLSDKNTFINKELQTDANDAHSKLEETKLPLDIHKETSTKILLESSEKLTSSTLDTASKNDTLKLNGSSKSENESSTNLEHKVKLDNKIKTDNTAKENIEDKKEEVMESVESKGIFASLTETFTMLSSSQDTTESTTIQNDILVSKAENDMQLKQVLEDIETKDITAEKHIPTIQTELDSSIDSSLINKEKIEIQQEIIHENIESAKVLDEKTKIEKEASIILLENATSSSDVPLSNNFIHKDTAKPAKELPITSSIVMDDSSTAKTDINSIKNIQIEETSKKEKITENIKEIDSSLAKESIIFDLKKAAATKSASTQSSSEIEQKLPGDDKTHPKEEDVSHKETFDQVRTDNKISKTTNLSPEMAIKENITKESFSESHTMEKNIVIIDESLNHSAADIPFTEKFIVHNNVNKNDNSVDDSLDNVPIESNKFSNDITPGIFEQSLDSSQEEISDQITNFSEVLQNQNLSNVKEDLEHEKNQFVNPVKEKTLPEYGDYINSEDKVLYKDEYTEEDNNFEKPESKPDEIEGINFILLISNNTSNTFKV